MQRWLVGQDKCEQIPEAAPYGVTGEMSVEGTKGWSKKADRCVHAEDILTDGGEKDKKSKKDTKSG